jgi:hypothetical protein
MPTFSRAKLTGVSNRHFSTTFPPPLTQATEVMGFNNEEQRDWSKGLIPLRAPDFLGGLNCFAKVTPFRRLTPRMASGGNGWAPIR